MIFFVFFSTDEKTKQKQKHSADQRLFHEARMSPNTSLFSPSSEICTIYQRFLKKKIFLKTILSVCKAKRDLTSHEHFTASYTVIAV